jgi:hypothetical protein
MQEKEMPSQEKEMTGQEEETPPKPWDHEGTPVPGADAMLQVECTYLKLTV